jgi:hypothetical protein
MTVIKTTIRDRRIDVPAPNEFPDGMEVFLTIGTSVPDDENMPSEEIARVLATMRKLEPLEIPADTATDLEAWERTLNQHGSLSNSKSSAGPSVRMTSGSPPSP